MLRYVGDSINLKERVRQHCTGNVESSTLRKTIAEKMGFQILKKKKGKRTKITVESKEFEQKISDYIQTGTWRWMKCPLEENLYKQFQWFLIEKKKPPLNKKRDGHWDHGWDDAFREHEEIIDASHHLQYKMINEIEKLSGVYLFFHKEGPEEFSSEHFEKCPANMNLCSLCSSYKEEGQECDCDKWNCFDCIAECEDCDQGYSNTFRT